VHFLCVSIFNCLIKYGCFITFNNNVKILFDAQAQKMATTEVPIYYKNEFLQIFKPYTFLNLIVPKTIRMEECPPSTL
jgi:hypothetical protein